MVNAKLRVLRLLIESTRAMSINGVAKDLRINYKTAYIAAKALLHEGVINMNVLGNRNACNFNGKLNASVFAVEEERREDLLKKKDLSVISKRLLRENPFYTLAVFGSHAKGTANKNSDIDLCLITDNENLAKEIEKEVRLLPLETHLLHFTAQEFREMLSTAKRNVGHEIRDNRVVLYGIENFYRLAYG